MASPFRAPSPSHCLVDALTPPAYYELSRHKPALKGVSTMVRIIGSVVAGYVTMFVAVFLLFSAGYLVLGAEGSFQPGSWDVSFVWVVLSIVVSLAGAVAGGYVCAVIAKDPKGPVALVVVVVVLGLLMALPMLMGGAPEPPATLRPEDVGLFDAMQSAHQPTWIALLNPLLGAVGVLIGTRLYKRPGTDQA